MIRALALGSILLIAQALPAWAERVTIKCEVPSLHLDYYTFDTDALTVLVEYNFDVDHNAVSGTYSIRLTVAEIKWQVRNRRSGDLMSFNYHRDTAKMFIFFGPDGYESQSYIWAGDCTKVPRGPV
jgi:hypothetical protein